MGIGAQDHPAAACIHFTHILMNDRNVRRNIDSPVLFCRRQAKHMVILVDGAAYGAEGIVAVGQHIWNGKLFHAGGLCRLDNAYKCNIVRCHGVKFQL